MYRAWSRPRDRKTDRQREIESNTQERERRAEIKDAQA